MMKLTKLRSYAVLAVATLAIPFSAYAQKKPHIIVVTHGQVSDSFWLVVKNGVEAAAKETNSDVDYRAPEKFDMVALSQLIDAAVASKPDGLIVSIPDADALGKSIQAAVAAKIPVISINSGSAVLKKLGCRSPLAHEAKISTHAPAPRIKPQNQNKTVV